MHLTVIAFGTPGDVEPLLAVASGLHDRGHEVRLATHPNWETLVLERGLEFASLHPNIEHLVRHPAFREVVDAGRSPRRLVRALVRASRAAAGPGAAPAGSGAGRGTTSCRGLRSLFAAAHRFDDAVLDDLDAACRGTDAMVYGAPLAPVAHHLAAAHGHRTAAALIQPLDYLGGPGHVLEAARRGELGEALCRLGRDLVRELAWHGLYRPALSRWSRLHGRMRPPWTSPFSRWRQESLPVVYGLSPAVLVRPDSWPADWEMVGFWFNCSSREPVSEESPLPGNSDLEAFLDSDQDVVYLDFGSMVTADTATLVRCATEATAAVGASALIQRGWAELATDRPAHHVRFVEADQRERALRAANVLVHHGGVMATATGLRLGLPTVVVPSVGDQYVWGRRVAEIGTGPEPVPRRRLDTARLTEALRGALDPATRKQACAVAAGIAHDDGQRRAAEILENALQSRVDAGTR